jgi:hypothetical protein
MSHIPTANETRIEQQLDLHFHWRDRRPQRVQVPQRAAWPQGLEQQIADGASAIDAMVSGLPTALAEAVRVQLAAQAGTSRAMCVQPTTQRAEL